MSEKNRSTYSDNSVSKYIEGLREGDHNATQKIWERFIHRLVKLALYKLKNTARSSMDEEDVVQQAFSEFFLQVQNGRFPKLHDRNDLWQVLAMLVDRRAKDQMRRQNALRAGGGRIINGMANVNSDSQQQDLLANIPSREPTADEASEFVDALRIRLSLLKKEDQRDVALLKLQGFSNQEIADQIGASIRTVERILSRIRDVWENTGESE